MFVAVQAPEEDRVFSSAREAIRAGHQPGSDWGDTLTTYTVLVRTYVNEFIPKLSAALGAPPPAEQVWLPFEERCVEASFRLATETERRLVNGTWQADTARSEEDVNAVASRVWAIHLEFLTIGYLACDALVFRTFGSGARDPLMDEVANILFANFKKLSNPRGPAQAIADMHAKMFHAVLAQYEEYGRMLSESGWPSVIDDFAAEICRISDVTPMDDVRREVTAGVQPIVEMSQQ